jgi:hypothetical protein
MGRGEISVDPPHLRSTNEAGLPMRGCHRVVAFDLIWEGEAPAEPDFREGFGSAGASPSRTGKHAIALQVAMSAVEIACSGATAL